MKTLALVADLAVAAFCIAGVLWMIVSMCYLLFKDLPIAQF